MVMSAAAGVQRIEGEARDCTVRALANALGAPYKLAHKILAKAGRREGRGMSFEPLYKVYTRLGFDLVAFYGETKTVKYLRQEFSFIPHEKGITLARMLPRLQNGRYIVKVDGHVFAVVDGKVLDYGENPSGSRVMALFKLEKQSIIF